MEYFELPPEQNIFHTLLADVTHRCNMSCANCYIPNRDIPDMDKEKLFDFVKRLPKRTDIRMIGAEATLRRDLPEIIQKIRSIGHRPTLLTNGLKLSSLQYTESLKRSGLHSLGLSLNGADDDAIYEIIDGGRYAKRKTEALTNCLRVGLVTHINCIIAKGVNDTKIPRRLYQLLFEISKQEGRKFSRLSYPIMLRFKSVGQVGRYMNNTSMPLDDLINRVFRDIDINKSDISIIDSVDGFSECSSKVFEVRTSLGPLLFKFTDWSVNNEGVPDPGSKRRGRITPEFKCAPFFEHVKLNEFGY
jgi:hypothetical protein